MYIMWKIKSEKKVKRFVSELKKVVSISGFPMYILHIHILVLFWWMCYIMAQSTRAAEYTDCISAEG